jgi:chitin synthase
MSDNVMNTYTTVSTQPKHYIQYDLGEDRWLTNLLFQQGWRVEYSAVSGKFLFDKNNSNKYLMIHFLIDSYTACPESFKEFYNQRKRWMPSTLANYIELLSNYKQVIKNSNDMSIFYILYQVIVLIFALTGPGMTFILLIITTESIIGVDSTISLIINAIPLIMFILVCFFAKADSQIYFARILTVIYAMLMMAVPISMALQLEEDTLSFQNLIAFGLLFGPIHIAAILHPQVKIEYSKITLHCKVDYFVF